jgi:hypothetical protein
MLNAKLRTVSASFRSIAVFSRGIIRGMPDSVWQLVTCSDTAWRSLRRALTLLALYSTGIMLTLCSSTMVLRRSMDRCSRSSRAAVP